MAAARRFLTDLPPDFSGFARDALLDAWASLLPPDTIVRAPRGIGARLRLLGKETVVLTAGRPNRQPSGDPARRIPADSLVALWNHTHRVAPVGERSALAVSTGAEAVISADALASAATAVAGEDGLSGIRVFQLADGDATATKELVRAFRRLTEIPVTLVVHAGSVEDTVTALGGCSVVVSHDETATVIAASTGLPVVRLGTRADVTEAYLAIRAGATRGTVTAPDADATADARALAFALDAWARGRMSLSELRAASADATRIDDLVGA